MIKFIKKQIKISCHLVVNVFLCCMDTPVDNSSMLAIDMAIILLFIALAAIAALLVLLFGRIAFKRWYSWLRLFGSAFLGGFVAVGVFWFAAEFEAVRSSQSLESFNQMLLMVAYVLLPLMLVLPIVSIFLRHRSAKIRQLELEVSGLKAQLAAAGKSASVPPPVSDQNASATTK